MNNKINNMNRLTLFSLMIFLLSSCGTASFNKQKFTSLKKLKQSESTSHQLSPVTSEKSAADKNQDGEPNEDLIKMGIENNTLFILKQKDGYYKCNNITYDGIYKSISADLEKVDKADFQNFERIELQVVSGIEFNAIKSTISLKDLTASNYVKGEKKTTKTEEKQMQNCQDIIYLKNGDSLLARVDYTSKENVYYYPCAEEKKNVLIKSKSEVARIQYHDGGPIVQDKPQKESPSNHISKDESSCGDLMILNSGLEIPVRIIQIRSGEISYKKCSDGLNRTFIKKKKYISKVKFSDGYEYEIKNSSEEHMLIEYDKQKQKNGARAVGMVILGMVLGVILLSLLLYLF
jgi:hypothetical protein